MELTVITLNVRGLRKRSKRLSVFTYLQDKKADIVFLQETFCTKDNIKKFNADWEGLAFHSVSSSKHSKGVCILLRKELNINIINTIKDSDGRGIIMNADIDNNMHSLVSVYCPNDDSKRAKHISLLSEWITEHAKNADNLIIGGDFNCNSDDNITKPLSAKCLQKVLTYLNACDTWKLKNPTESCITYIDPSGRGYSSRIDLIIASNAISRNIQSCNVIPSPGPDH